MSLYDNDINKPELTVYDYTSHDDSYKIDQKRNFLETNPITTDGQTYLDKIRIKGRDRAIELIYTNLYKKYYLRKPLLQMIELQEKIDNLDEELIHWDVFITINPWKMTDVVEKEFRKHCNYISKRSWVMKTLNTNFEYRNKDEKTGLHFHGGYRLKKAYSPSDISSILYRGIFKKYVMTKKHIHVEKIKSYQKCIDYINKDKNVEFC